MFIKFNGKLLDVGGCYFCEPTEFDATNPYNMSSDYESIEPQIKYRIILQSNTHPQIVGICYEPFDTKSEADQRFAELEAMLCGNRKEDIYFLMTHLEILQKSVIALEKNMRNYQPLTKPI